MKRLLIFLIVFTMLVLTFGVSAQNQKELISMRSEFSKVFKNEDGTITRRYWVYPVHFLNEKNQWEEIDRSIVDIKSNSAIQKRLEKDYEKLIKNVDKDAKVENYNKALTKHLFNMYFPKKLNHFIHFKYNNHLFSMKPINPQHIHKQKEKIKAEILKENEITYEEVWYNTDIKYQIAYNGVREYIILKDINAERNFSFFIKAKGFDLKTLPTGEIGAYSNKTAELIFVLPKPVMWDANNVYCYDINYELLQDKNGYILKYNINQDYLNAPERVYPVTIDPDIILDRNYVDEMTFIDTNNPDTNYYSSARMEMGNYEVWNWWFWDHWEKKRGIFRFNRLTADLGPVSDQVVVKQAKLYLECSENETETTFADVYHINFDAPDWEVTQVTWNSPWGNGGSSVLPAYEDTWVYIVKGESYPRTYVCYLDNSTVETWIHSNEYLNKGLMLIDYYEDTQTSTLKKFDNVSLEIILNEEIFIEVSTSIYPNTPQTIQFTAEASSATCGTITNYEWDFDINDGYYDGDTRQNPIYCYQTPGEHVFSVKATDINGHSRIYYGIVNVPALEVSAYYGITDPKTLRFITNTNYNCTYTWDFGDGSPAYIGVEGYHQYMGEGTYPVTLTITNNYGVNPLTITKNLYYYQPIILIHGYGGDYLTWDKLHVYFNQVLYDGDLFMKNFARNDSLNGLPVHTIFNFDYYRDLAADERFLFTGCIGTDGSILSTTGTGSYGEQYNSLDHRYSEMLSQAIANVCAATGFDKVDIVAHSMGGLVSRACIKYFGGIDRVDKLLTLGTPNHGIPSIEEFAAKLIAERDWMRELEVREMAYNSDTFYLITDSTNLMGWVEFLNNDGHLSIDGENISGCLGNDTLGPTEYATIAGRDNGEVDVPLVDYIWEWLAPDDGVVESGSVRLNGVNVVTNLDYPGIHCRAVPGNRSDLQVITETPFVASFVNTWMRQERILNAVTTKPVAWVEVEKYSDGTVKKFIVHTGATKDNAIWTWAMLQHEEEVATETGSEFYFTFKDYNSFWKDLSNATTGTEAIIDLSPAHYQPGDTLRVTVITYDTHGCVVEYIPVQL